MLADACGQVAITRVEQESWHNDSVAVCGGMTPRTLYKLAYH